MLDLVARPEELQRARGRVEVGYHAEGLKHLYQSGCCKALFPKSFQTIDEVVLINSSGGVTGGDHLAHEVEVERDAALCLTSQTAERIYRSVSGAANISNTLRLGNSSRLEWLPQETILFEGSALERRLDVEMAESATLLALETLILGRKAMGETLENVALRDHWRVRRGGRLIYADALRLETPLAGRLASKATLDGCQALSTLLYVAPDAEQHLDRAQEILPNGVVEASASAWDGLLSVRFLAPDAQLLRRELISFLKQFRGRDLPRVWHM